jgi:hypothetical protein
MSSKWGLAVLSILIQASFASADSVDAFCSNGNIELHVVYNSNLKGNLAFMNGFYVSTMKTVKDWSLFCSASHPVGATDATWTQLDGCQDFPSMQGYPSSGAPTNSTFKVTSDFFTTPDKAATLSIDETNYVCAPV